MTQLLLILPAGMEPDADSAIGSFFDRGGRFLPTDEGEIDQHKVLDHLPFELRFRPMLRQNLDLPESLLGRGCRNDGCLKSHVASLGRWWPKWPV